MTGDEDDRSVPPIQVQGVYNGFNGRMIHENLDLTVERGKVLTFPLLQSVLPQCSTFRLALV